jgi:hypothetical protein
MRKKMNPSIAIVNQSTVVTDAQVQDVIAALKTQLSRDFAPIWRIGASLYFWPKTKTIPVGMWQLVILDNSDQAGALGYHELTVNGDPIGKVFAAETISAGLQWSVTFSHELLEMLGDPDINLSAENGDNIYSYETCDACEDDSFGYDIKIANGAVIRVSDFVFPEWFNSATNKTKFDIKGHITKPLQLLMNGYIGVLQVGSGWVQLTKHFSDHAAEERAVPTDGSRRQRRTVNKYNWRRSTK